MCGQINSLNAGVAAALALYEILRQQGVEGNGLPACEPFRNSEEEEEEETDNAPEAGAPTPQDAPVTEENGIEGEAGFDETAGTNAGETETPPGSELE